MRKLRIHSSLKRDTVIYRYLSLESFLALTQAHQTHLTKVTEWDDPWEAILAKLPTVDAKGNARRRVYSFHEGAFGQSWSFLPESDAMWRIYSPAKTGLIIAASVDKFELLKGAEQLYLGPVVYFQDIDELRTKSDSVGSLQSLCFKRSAFEHEREVRLLTLDQFVPGCDVDAKHLYLNLDPRRFLESITIDPRAPRWIVEAVKGYCQGLRLPEPIQSELYAPDPHLSCGMVSTWVPVKDPKKP